MKSFEYSNHQGVSRFLFLRGSSEETWYNFMLSIICIFFDKHWHWLSNITRRANRAWNFAIVTKFVYSNLRFSTKTMRRSKKRFSLLHSINHSHYETLFELETINSLSTTIRSLTINHRANKLRFINKVITIIKFKLIHCQSFTEASKLVFLFRQSLGNTIHEPQLNLFTVG